MFFCTGKLLRRRIKIFWRLLTRHKRHFFQQLRINMHLPVICALLDVKTCINNVYSAVCIPTIVCICIYCTNIVQVEKRYLVWSLYRYKGVCTKNTPANPIFMEGRDTGFWLLKILVFECHFSEQCEKAIICRR